MIVPEICVPWIKLQRSGYSNHKEGYKKDIEKEYELMLPCLPDKCNSVLDIGCGVGGINVLLSKHYNHPELHLLDNSIVSDKIVYGYTDKESYYNSFDATKELMDVNGITNYKLIDINGSFPKINNIDIVLSLLACGFHYSISYYIENIYNVITDDGVLIFDMRKETDQLSIVQSYFKDISEIETINKKSIRICARGKI